MVTPLESTAVRSTVAPCGAFGRRVQGGYGGVKQNVWHRSALPLFYFWCPF